VTDTPSQSLRFLWLYALAAAGGAVAYVPFLTILLPVRMSELSGAEDVEPLAYAAFAGAIAASLANIAFGWLSDRTGSRRGWILAGLALSSALLVSVRATDDIAALIALIVVWQLALNMMLGPLAAMAGDLVPHAQKGLLGGLLAFAPAAGAAAGAMVTWPGLADADGRLVLVAALTAAMVLPVLLFGRPVPMPQLMVPEPAETRRARPRSLVARMWLARLLVQLSEAALFAYLLYWFRSIDASVTDSETARIFTLVLVAAVPLSLLAGRWSDRADRPILPLATTAAIASLGLVLMAMAETREMAIAGYVLFGLVASIFLALHSAQTLRVLPRPQTRGRDLGLFNLTNTTPSLIMPWLTLSLVPGFGFDALFAVLAALALLASLLLATARVRP
jgi:MFS family permease